MQSVVELGPGASSVILGRYGPDTLQLFGIEHDARFASVVRWFLEQHGIANYRLLEAPLTPQSFDGRVIEWYDPVFIEELPDRIDALVVDRPPGTAGRLARAPAWPRLCDRMRPGGACSCR